MNPIVLDRLDAMEAWVRRRRWWFRLATALVVVPWLSWFVYTRATTMPPGMQGASRDDIYWHVAAPPGDRGEDLASAMGRLPPIPRLIPPASNAGWQALQTSGGWWGMAEVDFAEALRGEWAPAKRYHLQQITKYVQNPATDAALKEIASLAGQPFTLQYSERMGWNSAVQQFTRVVSMLVVRARGRMAEQGDFDGALVDLETALQLVAGMEDDGRAVRLSHTSYPRLVVLEEVTHWATEFALPVAQTRKLVRLLETYRLDIQKVWPTLREGEAAAREAMLDAYYTKDADGNGWPVVIQVNPGQRFGTLLCALNVLGWPMNDRRTMQEKIGRGLRELEESPDLSAGALLERTRQEWMFSTPADYVFAQINRYQQNFLWVFPGAAAKHAGAVTSLALAAYKAEHGRYPEDLSQLVRQYLAKLPKDPYADGGLRYRLDESSGYVLYSVDNDGTDHGGTLRQDELPWHRRSYDLLLSLPREGAQNEWIAVAAPGSAPAGSSGNGDVNDAGE